MTTVGSGAGGVPVCAGGLLAVGACVSLIVIVCVTVVALPQLSVYVHVLVTVPPQRFAGIGESTPVTVPAPSQLSIQFKSVIAGISPGHSTVISAGAGSSVGACVSLIVIVCVAVAEFPQASVYVQVLVTVPPQYPPTTGPSTPVTVPAPSQLSVHPRSVIAGTSPTHSTVTGPGGGFNIGFVTS